MSFDFGALKNKYNQMSRSKDGRVLVANFAYLSVLQIIGYIFPLITIPYLSRVIGVEGYGKIAFAASVIVYFQTVVDWGFAYTAVRDIAKNKDDIHKVSKIFSNVMFSKIILMFVSLAIFAVLVYTVPFMYNYRMVLWCTFLLIPGYMIFPDWLFQAMEEMKYITLMNFTAKTLFTALVFLVIRDSSDYVYEPLLNASGMLVSGILALWYARKKFKINFIMPTCKDIKAMIKGSFNVFVSLFLPNLYSNFSIVLLGVYGGEIVTGLYSAGNKFLQICNQFAQVLSRVFFPFLARRIENHKYYVRINGIISILMSVVLFCGADLLVKIFYTPDFDAATAVIRIMAISPFFLFLDNTYGTNYIILKGHDYIVRNIVTVCSIGGFLFAWMAVINWSYIGVAITMVLVRGFMGTLTWCYARRYINTKRHKS